MSFLTQVALAVVVALALAAFALWIREYKRFKKLSKAHAELSKAASELEAVVAHAIVQVDEKGLIRSANPAAEVLFGYVLEEIRGRNILELVLLNAETKEETRERLSSMQGVEAEARRKDGTLVPAWLRMAPIQSEGEILVRFLIEDLTRPQRQAQLEMENQLLWPTFDEAGLVIALVNPEGEIIRLSTAGVDWLNLSDSHAEGFRYWELFQQQDDWESARASFELAKRKMGPSRLNADWIDREQRSVPLDWLMLSPSWDDKGDLAHVVVTASVASPANAANRRQTAKTIERVVGRIAGRFENLLSTINGYSELVLHDLAPSSPLRKDVEQVVAASERATEMTHQLLSFSGHRLVSTELLDLHGLLRRVKRNLLASGGLEIELFLHDGPAMVLGNRKAFEQTLMALAEYATSSGRGQSRAVLETEAAKVSEPLAMIAGELAPGDYLKLKVALGNVPQQEVLRHLSEPFSSPLRGTGHSAVGLALVNGIARSSGGLLVTPAKDKSVALEIWSPAASVAAAENGTPADAAQRARTEAGTPA